MKLDEIFIWVIGTTALIKAAAAVAAIAGVLWVLRRC